MRYDNTAYDYNSVRASAPAPRVAPQKKAQIRTIPAAQPKRRAGTALVTKLAVCAVVIFMVCFNIYTRVEISDTQREIDKAVSQLEELDSEKTVLEMKMESIVSYTNLEQEAQRLGMQKKTKQQVHYFDSSSSDRAEIVG